MAATIELRGEADVTHAYAERDARGILDFLAARGVLATPPTTVPALRCESLAAGPVRFRSSRRMAVWSRFARRPGEQVPQGRPHRRSDRSDHRCDHLHRTRPSTACFSRADNRRYAVAGMSLGKVAGRDALRSGKLLSA